MKSKMITKYLNNELPEKAEYALDLEAFIQEAHHFDPYPSFDHACSRYQWKYGQLSAADVGKAAIAFQNEFKVILEG